MSTSIYRLQNYGEDRYNQFELRIIFDCNRRKTDMKN